MSRLSWGSRLMTSNWRQKMACGATSPWHSVSALRSPRVSSAAEAMRNPASAPVCIPGVVSEVCKNQTSPGIGRERAAGEAPVPHAQCSKHPVCGY